MSTQRFVIFLVLTVILVAFHGASVGAQTAENSITTGTSAGPAIAYFPALPYGSGPDTTPELIPMVASHPLAGIHDGIHRAVIVIHDRNRDANAPFNLLMTLAGAAGPSTLIIAPQFLLESDLINLGAQLPDHGRMFARWPLNGEVGAWEDGGDSTPLPPQKGISSYTVMDLLLVYFSDRIAFPDLEQITVVGNGAGGDFVTRYAALGQGVTFLDKAHIATRFVAANPSSFLYLTQTRPIGKKGFGTVDSAQCPKFNDYKYGLDNLNPYGRRIGANAIKLGYVARNVTYLLGEAATSGDAPPDMDCAALEEGADRTTRANNYNLYLAVTYGEAIHATQRFVTIPKAGYDPSAIYASKCGLISIFGDGQCPQGLSTNGM